MKSEGCLFKSNNKRLNDNTNFKGAMNAFLVNDNQRNKKEEIS
jgi:hypothetical protein